LVTPWEIYIFWWVTASTVDALGLGTTFVWGISWWSIVFGVVYALRIVVGIDGSTPWLKTLQNVRDDPNVGVYQSSGILLVAMWAILTTAAFTTATHPQRETLRFLYGYQINFAVRIAEKYFQAVFGLGSLFANETVSRFVEITVNNLRLTLRAMVLGAVGGVVLGLGIPLVLIIATNAAMVVGVFVGVVVRNNIVIGNGLLTPPLAYLAGFGAMHTFLEYTAFVLAGTGAGFAVYGVVRGRGDRIGSGLRVGLLGVGLVAIAGIVEVGASPFVVAPLRGNLTVDLSLVAVDLGASWAVGTGSMLVTSSVVLLALAFATNQVV
jgi:hypothetical protein